MRIDSEELVKRMKAFGLKGVRDGSVPFFIKPELLAEFLEAEIRAELEAMNHFNQLTPAEAERLALLAEELGEAIQAIGKILRHGYETTHPEGGPTNREALERECGDVRHAIIRMCNEGDLSRRAVHERANYKAQTVGRYLHHQGNGI